MSDEIEKIVIEKFDHVTREFPKNDRDYGIWPQAFVRMPGIVQWIHNQEDWDKACKEEEFIGKIVLSVLLIAPILFTISMLLAIYRVEWYLNIWGIK